ncbi:MAG: SMP-30/gluconolactonase/LRE family protein [Chloroflexi bacterium AL-W]|nr:SMP-30/gluconolactonase/LRE family protein [Chloroflexi bacterium AL-N1]NOK70088.1 SMP-30/gluconolactonase/LRE family protein [Chloroflexi bacterium AL-N10]NOK77900.1 SMP-30/gluconolactonase/LRE family protein [Chloroflexi bacterium AL-N5]NOK84909.1 SMP-30/gluconolactonase/LRE family protein [Chloroflexi bacterium AL-W]NOK91888.1 SMP-30/gluconolactonase/LRE family protein [Chloroflexi bacterium AL-N15]
MSTPTETSHQHQPTLIADYACVTGEGPLWHPDEGCVYWVDIPMGRLFRYYPSSGRHEQCLQSDAIGGFTRQADGSLLLFMDKGAIRRWQHGALTTLIDEIPDERDTRFNDVIADPLGRVFCGTMATPERGGRLYRLDLDSTLTVLLEDIGVSNGLGFTPDLTQLYYTDSPKCEMYVFDYDQQTGALTNQRVFIQTDPHDGVPDGLTVDAQGFVWSAFWDGSCIIRYTPDGVEEQRIAFPTRKVSSVTFGGPDYTDMYMTTAGGDNKVEEGASAGALFHLNLGIQGKAEFVSRIVVP